MSNPLRRNVGVAVKGPGRGGEHGNRHQDSRLKDVGERSPATVAVARGCVAEIG